mgnify:CR=1 FL=1
MLEALILMLFLNGTETGGVCLIDLRNRVSACTDYAFTMQPEDNIWWSVEAVQLLDSP